MSIAEVNELTYSGSSGNGRCRLDHVSFSMEKGEYLAVLGNSRSGKTELARHLNALIRPESGCVTVCGLNTADAQNERSVREKCAMVFRGAEEHFVCRTVGEETAYALRNFGRDAAAAGAVLKKVGFHGTEDHPLTELNRVDAVRVSVAAAIAAEPELLILDNILSPLTGCEKREIRQLIKKLNDDGMSILLVTDCAADAADAERFIVMHEGKLLRAGLRSEVFSDREIFDAAQIAVPFAVRAYFDLSDADVRLNSIPLTEDELVDEICR